MLRIGIGGKFGDAIFKARILQCLPDRSVDLYLSPFCRPLARFFSRVRSVASLHIDEAAQSHFGHGEHVRWSVPIDIDTAYQRYPDEWCPNFVARTLGYPTTHIDAWFGTFAYVLDGLAEPALARPSIYADLRQSPRREQTLTELRQRLPDFDFLEPDENNEFVDNMLLARACVERLANFDGGMTLMSVLGLSTIVDLGTRATGVNHTLFAVANAALKRSEEVADYLLHRVTTRYSKGDSRFWMGRRATGDVWRLWPRERPAPRRRITLVTAYDDPWAAMGGPSAANKEAYCQRHGYRFVCERSLRDPTRSPSWNKVLHVLKHLPDCDWLFWSDADAVVMNGGVKLEHLINDEYDFIVSCDQNGMNAGHFFIRNCTWSLDFLNEVWRQERFVSHGWWEQAAMRHLIDTVPRYAERILVTPNKLFNGYLHDGTYERGDFIVHFPGQPGREYMVESFAKLSTLWPKEK